MSTPKPVLHMKMVLAIALTTFLLLTFSIVLYVLQHTNGVFSYPLDDAFIHLAIGKTLAFYKVWGICRYEFASASSSILYPLLLAVFFFIFGAHAVISLIINILAGTAFLMVLQRWLSKQGITSSAQLYIILAIILLTPLPIIVISGMEHTLQMLFCFLFITRWSDEWAAMLQDKKDAKGFSKWAYTYGALLVATRYEGMVIVAVACLAMLWHRKWWFAFELGVLSLLPVLVFGVISVSKGSYFIPNSVLLKSSGPELTFKGLYDFFTQWLYKRLTFSFIGYNTVATQRLLFLLPFTYLLFARQFKTAVTYRYQLILLMVAVFAHLLFAKYVSFPRYEAYLIGVSVAIVGALVAKFGIGLFQASRVPTQWVAGLLALLVIFPLILRSKDALLDTGQACVNVYEQQYQMGQLLHRYYFNGRTAVGDIGAISYFTEGRNLDLEGLANKEVAHRKREKNCTPEFLYELNKKQRVQLAICYDAFNDPRLLSRWTKMATWTIPNNIACGDATVSIYAVDTAEIRGLAKNLREFEPHLPKDVVVKYYYTPLPDTADGHAISLWSHPPVNRPSSGTKKNP